jgi:hypothetical protein
MTREDAAKLWPIIKAYSEGKQVQHRVEPGAWADFHEPSFRDPADRYRIKPEPVERWMVFSGGVGLSTYDNEDMAQEHVRMLPSLRVVHLREVEE